MKIIKTPLRYPGGKSRALEQILPLVPRFQEFREPMVGGGSVFLRLKQQYPQRQYWINDINYELYSFWKTAQMQLPELVKAVQEVKDTTTDGKALFYDYLAKYDTGDEFARAVRFFVLNRITFSGTVDSGGYSEQAFHGRFTQSSIDLLSKMETVLEQTKITHQDYSEVVNAPGEDVFLFLDPPYYSVSHSRLYGRKGELHTTFDHERFAQVMRDCPHSWLITYDDCPEVRKLFKFACITEWTLQYGMNNYKQETAKRGNELFISNYDIEQKLLPAQLSLVIERQKSYPTHL